MRLRGKGAIITGAAGGIGRSTALALAREGADLLLVDVDARGLADTAAQVLALGRKASELVLDVSEDGVARRIVDTARDELGGFHILVNGAEVADGAHFLEASEDTLDRVIGVNLRAPFLLGSEVAGYWIEHEIRGRIVNISSIHAETIEGRASVYCAAKGGIRMLTVAAACDLGPHGITVNAVGPGQIRTGTTGHGAALSELEQDWIARTPLRRLGVPDDVARAVVFLVSDDASYITGQTIYVEGGRTIHIP